MNNLTGTEILHYKIGKKIGEGGMGVVYKAEDITLDRFVALKFPRDTALVGEKARERFIREAKAAAALDHPNICTIFDVHEVEGLMFIALAYVDGENLKDRIKSGAIDLRKVLDIVIQICEGLSAAHSKGIIHRDIKSANVMLTNGGLVKIMDFGIAKNPEAGKFTNEGTMIGTSAYTSPERYQDLKLDTRADIFSLGVVIYELLTGNLPFRGEYEAAVSYDILNTDPESLTGIRQDIPIELERVVNKMLAKDREKRYQTVEQLSGELRLIRDNIETLERRSAFQSFMIKHGKKRFHLIAGIAVFLILILTVIYVIDREDAGIDSIAVLPLADISLNENEFYFAEGMTDELINRLSRIENFRVISRTSVMSYKGVNKSLREIAGELKVDAIVEGTVRRVEGRIRTSVRLIDAENEEIIWAGSYEYANEDILMLQNKIALSIAEQVKARLEGEDKAELMMLPTGSVRAHEFYMKGRYYWNKRTPDALKKGFENFTAAVNEDPSYAQAYAGIADSYIMLVNYTDIKPDSLYLKARWAALKAIEIDDRLAEAHTSIAIVRWNYDWNLQGAEKAFREAIELNPNYVTAHHWYAMFLALTGRFSEAELEIQRGLIVDPVSLIVNAASGLISYYGGKYDLSINRSRKTIDMDSNFFAAYTVLGQSLIQKGKYMEASKILEEVIQRSGRRSYPLTFLAVAKNRAGEQDAAEAIYKELKERNGKERVSCYDMAIVSVAVGRREESLDWLEKAMRKKSFGLFHIKVEPVFESIRELPRFKSILETIGINEVKLHEQVKK